MSGTDMKGKSPSEKLRLLREENNVDECHSLSFHHTLNCAGLDASAVFTLVHGTRFYQNYVRFTP